MKRDRHIIQKYLDHELSQKDMKRFEADLEASPELQADLNLYREVDEALADTEVLSFREQLSDLRRETKETGGTKKTPFRFTRPWHYAASAAVALILAIGLATILDRPLSNKDLLKKYYAPYEVALINRSLDTQLDAIIRHGESFYQEGNYEKALECFSMVLEKQPDEIATTFYSGISNYELENYSEASTSMNKVIEHNDNLFIERAEWYLGMCFLATNENDRARRQFARIASGNSEKKREAAKILRKLRK